MWMPSLSSEMIASISSSSSSSRRQHDTRVYHCLTLLSFHQFTILPKIRGKLFRASQSQRAHNFQVLTHVQLCAVNLETPADECHCHSVKISCYFMKWMLATRTRRRWKTQRRQRQWRWVIIIFLLRHIFNVFYLHYYYKNNRNDGMGFAAAALTRTHEFICFKS